MPIGVKLLLTLVPFGREFLARGTFPMSDPGQVLLWWIRRHSTSTSSSVSIVRVPSPYIPEPPTVRTLVLLALK
jgi:hypothetical protein